MNIFKILDRGHGNISETNLSAFIGYLLDPNEDHGLQDEFLKAFLMPLFPSKRSLEKLLDIELKQDITLQDLIFNKDYTVDIKYEKSIENKTKLKFEDIEPFNKENKKIILDLVKNQKGKQRVDLYINFYVLIRGAKSAKPDATFLIENKTKADPTTGQIFTQLFYSFLNIDSVDLGKSIFSIYLTPAGENYKKEWELFSGQKFQYIEKIFEIKGEHILWSGKNKESSSDENIMSLIDSFPVVKDVAANNINSTQPTLSDILKNIIKRESSGDTEPLDDYLKHTLKAFKNFIDNDFNSDQNSLIRKIKDNQASRYEFYKYCLENEIRQKNELQTILNCEETVRKSTNMNYTIGANPMMIFYTENEPNQNFFLRIQFNAGNYEILSFADISEETLKENPISLINDPQKEVLNRRRYRLPTKNLNSETIKWFVKIPEMV